MQRAMAETDRRRAKQVAYNKAHGITPKGVEKAVSDIMEGAFGGRNQSAKAFAEIAEQMKQYGAQSPKELAKQIDQLEQKMFQHAQNLEFEEAGRVRDEIQRMEKHLLGLGGEAPGKVSKKRRR